MRFMITPEGEEPHEATDGELAGSPHRQVSHALVALPVGSTIVLTVPAEPPIGGVFVVASPDGGEPFRIPIPEPVPTVFTYHSEDDE